jgi:hypothetical protein
LPSARSRFGSSSPLAIAFLEFLAAIDVILQHVRNQDHLHRRHPSAGREALHEFLPPVRGKAQKDIKVVVCIYPGGIEAGAQVCLSLEERAQGNLMDGINSGTKATENAGCRCGVLGGVLRRGFGI